MLFNTIIFDFLNLELEFIIMCMLSCALTGKSFYDRIKRCFYVFALTPVVYLVEVTLSSAYMSTFITLITTMVLAGLFIGIKSFDYFFIYLISFMVVFAYECLLSIAMHFIGNNPYTPVIQFMFLCICCLVTYVIYRLADFRIVYEIICSKSSGSKMLTANCFCIILFLTILFKCHINNFYNASVLIILCVISLVFINIEYFISKRYAINARARLAAYEQYIPIVEGLIDEIRIRQHDYNNELQSLYSMVASYDDIGELRKSVAKYSNAYTMNENVYQLLKLNTHLLGGLLISKYKQARNNNIDIIFNIKNFNISCCVPEYELIDMCGILIDNAIEHGSHSVPVYVSLASSDNTFSFTVKNGGPAISEELLDKMFAKGYTTKQQHEGHGIGMYKLKEMILSHNGDICVSNETIDNTTYLCIQLQL